MAKDSRFLNCRLKLNLTQYCHVVNSLTVKVFIANNGNFDETEKRMRSSLINIGVTNNRKYLYNVIRSAKIQSKRNAPPNLFNPLWNPPNLQKQTTINLKPYILQMSANS